MAYWRAYLGACAISSRSYIPGMKLTFRNRPVRIFSQPWGESDAYVVVEFAGGHVAVVARAELMEVV